MKAFKTITQVQNEENIPREKEREMGVNAITN